MPNDDSPSDHSRSAPGAPERGLPNAARVIVIGGGVVGCSVAYHLAKLGWQDVLLLEQGRIAGGTSWHAAGLVGQLRTSNSLTRINKESVELYQTLEAETGCETGWNEVGSLIVGTSEARMTQLRRTAAMAEVFGVEAHVIGPDEAGEKWPLMRVDDVLGAVWLPHDGKVIPEGVVKALAAGASNRGAQIVENVRVEEIVMKDGRARGVRTSAGAVRADWVILCGGMWTRQLGLTIGVDLPLHPVEHQYIVSEPIEEVDRNRPVGRDPNEMIYYRSEDDGSIMLGAFQKESIAWDVERVPDDFSFQLLDPDWEKYAQPLRGGKHRLPVLESCEWTKFVNGPESFTPDNNFLMGEPAVEYSFERQNWAPHVAAEVQACRENVALFDQSTFSKYRFRGADTVAILQRLCGNNVDVPVGRTVYTGLFNERGTFESDLTLVRVTEDEYYIVTSTGQQVHDYDWIARHIPPGADAELTDVTEDFGVLSVMGPQARDLLSGLTDSDLGNEAFPFGSAQSIEVGGAPVRALRLTYVGELGWELHCRTGDQEALYDAIVREGTNFQLAHGGHYAINAMRLEKAYPARAILGSPYDPRREKILQ